MLFAAVHEVRLWHVPEEMIGAGKVRSSGLIGQSQRFVQKKRGAEAPRLPVAAPPQLYAE
jgi:hypothetical protein